MGGIAGGYTEEIYKTYTSAKHRLGTVIETPDGCRYRFALNGAGALAAGDLAQAALPVANHAECVVAAAVAAGAKVITATLGATLSAVNQYKDGYVHVNKTPGLGHKYRVKSHLAVASAGVITLNLYEDSPVKVALTTSSEITLVPNPFRGVLIHDSPPTAKVAGVALVAVAASAYCWLQTRGPACVLVQGTHVIGDFVVPSATVDGAVMPSAAVETDGPPVGHVMVVNIDGEYGLVDLFIE